MTEAEIDQNEIEKALGIIEQEQTEIEEKKEAEVVEIKPQNFDGDKLIGMAVDSFNDVSKKADEIYDAFYGVVATRQDRSDVSKQMLSDSQRLKIESMNAVANMFNAQAKLLAAQQKQAAGNVGVFVNTKSGEDIGINLANLAD